MEAVRLTVPFQQLSLQADGRLSIASPKAWAAPFARTNTRDGCFPALGSWPAPRLTRCRHAGLSAAKAQTLRSGARIIADGILSDRQLEALPTPGARGRLQELAGIGPGQPTPYSCAASGGWTCFHGATSARGATWPR
jgi:3-methyladenine DNA glycosylase/8-oxoguanine DNA glycosylase